MDADVRARDVRASRARRRRPARGRIGFDGPRRGARPMSDGARSHGGDATSETEPAAIQSRSPRATRPPRRPRAPTVPRRLTVEQAAAIEPPREFRLSPDGRRVAFTAEAAGARQIFVMPVRGGYPEQLTATEKPVSDPQWSPDGRRIAFVRDEAIWMIDVEGSHQALVTQHPAGNRSPRWSPDGHQIAFVSRRRGWDQVWIVDAPVPRRGRPATHPRSAEPAAADRPRAWTSTTSSGRPTAARSRSLPSGSPDLLTSQIHVLDVATGTERLVAGETAWETGPRWLPDGSGLLFVSDRDGWFQVVPDRRRTAASARSSPTASASTASRAAAGATCRCHRRTGALRPHRDPRRAGGPGRRRTAGSAAGRRRPAIGARRSSTRSRACGWPSAGCPTRRRSWPWAGATRAPDDLWLLPMPEAAADGAKPRQLTHSLPSVVDTAHFATGTRVALRGPRRPVDRGHALPAARCHRRGSGPVPCVINSHGGPTHQTFRDWFPFRQLVVEAGMAYFSVDFRGSTGYGREFRLANRGEWGHADAFDVIDAAHGRLLSPGATGGWRTTAPRTAAT